MVGLGVEIFGGRKGHYGAAGPVYGLAGTVTAAARPMAAGTASRPGPPGERRARAAVTAVPVAPTAQHPATR